MMLILSVGAAQMRGPSNNAFGWFNNGNGSNLRGGFAVPPGGCLTTGAFIQRVAMVTSVHHLLVGIVV